MQTTSPQTTKMTSRCNQNYWTTPGKKACVASNWHNSYTYVKASRSHGSLCLKVMLSHPGNLPVHMLKLTINMRGKLLIVLAAMHTTERGPFGRMLPFAGRALAVEEQGRMRMQCSHRHHSSSTPPRPSLPSLALCPRRSLLAWILPPATGCQEDRVRRRFLKGFEAQHVLL